MSDRGVPGGEAGREALPDPAIQPLAGRSIVVTRTRTQASSLADRLAGLGATVVELPVIAIEGPVDGGTALAAAADRLLCGQYRWVVLTSANAVRPVITALGGRVPPPQVRWAVVGPGTGRALAEAGIVHDLAPGASVAEALVDAFPAPPSPDGPAVLFPRAETVRGALAAGLRAKGWEVDEVVAYRTVAGHPDPAAVQAATRAHAVAFTSSSTVDRTVELLGPDAIPPIVATIGPITSGSARDAGLRVAAEATEHTIDGLVAALVHALARRPDQRFRADL